jgi:hypothetical protein
MPSILSTFYAHAEYKCLIGTPLSNCSFLYCEITFISGIMTPSMHIFLFNSNKCRSFLYLKILDAVDLKLWTLITLSILLWSIQLTLSVKEADLEVTEYKH